MCTVCVCLVNCVGCQCAWVSVMRQRAQDTELTVYLQLLWCLTNECMQCRGKENTHICSTKHIENKDAAFGQYSASPTDQHFLSLHEANLKKQRAVLVKFMHYTHLILSILLCRELNASVCGIHWPASKLRQWSQLNPLRPASYPHLCSWDLIHRAHTCAHRLALGQIYKLCPLVVLTDVKSERVYLYMPFYVLPPPGLSWAQCRIRSARFIWSNSLPMRICGISLMALTWPFSVHTADIFSYTHRMDVVYVNTHNNRRSLFVNLKQKHCSHPANLHNDTDIIPSMSMYLNIITVIITNAEWTHILYSKEILQKRFRRNESMSTSDTNFACLSCAA